MNLPRATFRSGRRGSVLIVVLWLVFGLVSIALYFAHSMALELRASDNRASGVAADQAIEGASRYIAAVLAAYATNGVVPDLSLYKAEAVPVGDERFWILGRDNSAAPARSRPVFFGLVDEASKLNLNTASTNSLYGLPRMTPDMASAIADWRNPSPNGGSALSYAMLEPPYQCKGAPFETVDELRLVYGATLDLLAGEDLNRNGILDANETDENGNGDVDSGLLDLLTVYSREPNRRSDGTPLANVNNTAQLRPVLSARLGGGRAEAVLERLGLSSPPDSGGTNAESAAAAPPPIRGPLDLYLRSGMTADEFALVAGDITTRTASYTPGRVNVNTAGAAVLACLPGLDANAAQQLVAYRRANAGRLASVAWLADALSSNPVALQALAAEDVVTTQSYQFTADIAAVGPHVRGYRRVKFVFDVIGGTPRVVYRQDLSRLGWALGPNVRETWLARNTP